jgi:hypothetical protein
MAQPITWRDIAAPNLSGSIAASQAAGNQITQALSNIGTLGMDLRDQARADATKRAVAGILSSTDPNAAAAGVQQGWDIDPLAIAQAARTRDSQLRSDLASDASLEASRVATDANRANIELGKTTLALNKATLEDRTAEREASTMSSPMIDSILKTGKLPSIDLNQDNWKSAAGNKAYKQVLDFWGQYQDDKVRAEQLHLQTKAIRDKENQDAFFGAAREYGASADGQLADPATRDRYLSKLAKSFNVPSIYVDQAAQVAERGSQANTATQEELDQTIPGGTDSSFRDVNTNLVRRQNDLEKQKAAKISEFDRAVRGQELMQGTVFNGPSEGLPGELAKRTGWDLDEAQDRINRIRSEYPNITDAQAADIALATQDRWFDRTAARSPEAVSRAGAYAEFNKLGGAAGLNREMAKAAAPFDKELSRLPILARQVTGAARAGAPVPAEAQRIVSEFARADSTQAREVERAQQRALKAAQEEAAKSNKVLDAISQAAEVGLSTSRR